MKERKHFTGKKFDSKRVVRAYLNNPHTKNQTLTEQLQTMYERGLDHASSHIDQLESAEEAKAVRLQSSKVSDYKKIVRKRKGNITVDMATLPTLYAYIQKHSDGKYKASDVCEIVSLLVDGIKFFVSKGVSVRIHNFIEIYIRSGGTMYDAISEKYIINYKKISARFSRSFRHMVRDNSGGLIYVEKDYFKNEFSINDEK